MKKLLKNIVTLGLTAGIITACNSSSPTSNEVSNSIGTQSSIEKGITNKTVIVNGVNIFYREAGSPEKPTILMLHGLPTSSLMYRDVMRSLSQQYHLIAPDYPAFGLSQVPSINEFEYTFDNISALIEKFIDQMGLTSIYLMMQDYGGPIGMRIATKRPELINGLIIQNANMYMEGLGEWSQKIGGYVQSKDFEGLNNYKNYLFSPEGIKDQYTTGANSPEDIDPIAYLTDAALMQRAGINEIQTALFRDYKNNFPKYPEWQNYLKENQPPTLVIWGENDKFFSKAGAEAYKKDLKNVSINLFNSGHFMLEEYAEEASQLIKNFIK